MVFYIIRAPLNGVLYNARTIRRLDPREERVARYKAGTMEVQPNGAGLIPERRETVTDAWVYIAWEWNR